MRPLSLSVCLGRECIVAKRLGRLSWFPVHTHSNSNHVLGGGPILQIPSGARLPAAKVWAKVPLNWPKICLRIEVQYLGNAAWYGVGVNRWPIGNHPSSMLYLLARSALTQHDLEKSKITLASYDQPFLSKLSSCYCVLHFPIVPCNQGAPRKRGGEHSSKHFSAVHTRVCAPPHFWTASGATG